MLLKKPWYRRMSFFAYKSSNKIGIGNNPYFIICEDDLKLVYNPLDNGVNSYEDIKYI